MIIRAVKYLSNLWGLLSVTAVIFPGAAALFKLQIAPRESEISGLYTGLTTIFCSFSILFLTSFSEKLANLDWARKLALRAIVIAILSIFAFLTVKFIFVEIKVRDVYRQGDGKIVEIMKDNGKIMHSEHYENSDNVSPINQITTDYVKPDPLDIVQMAAFIITMSAITVAFSSLGLNGFYSKTQND